MKENSPQIRELIKQNGIDVCKCCEFEGSLWLEYNHSITGSVHGIGYSDEWENLTPQQELLRYLDEVEYPVFCIDVNDFIMNILKQQGNPIVSIVTLEDKLKQKAEEYSFNIESELFNRLNPDSELSELWKKEIEQAFMNGAKLGMEHKE